jgi:NodT family efflux transporter outer membrane factor (OMF) lipoprotein
MFVVPTPSPSRFATAIAGCAIAALAACSVGSPYKRPEIPTPAEWKQSSGEEPRATSDQADSKTSAASQAPHAPNAAGAWPATGWWHQFGSATLDDLIDAAERRNDDLAGAIARVQEADAQLRIAGAPLLPSLDFGADATRERAQVTGAGPKVFNLFNPQFTASYELDFWGKNRAARDAASAAALASRFDEQTVALTVVSSVATTYFQALELRDRIEVARRNLRNGDKILQGLRLQQSAGIATGLDVAQQETAVALLAAAIPPLVQQLRQTVYALAVLIGSTPESIDVDSGTLTSLTLPAVVEGMPSQLLARRPDVAQAEQQLVAAHADITVARASLFPSIELTAGGGYESSALSGLISPYTRVYAASAGITQPIFHGGALRGQLAYSKARYTELVTTYHKAVLTAFSNVESALVATQQVTEQELRQQDAVNKAQRAYQFAQTQMSAGTVNILNVLNTENALFSAQDELVQVQYLRLQALIGLYTALGGGWQQG